MVEGLGRKDFVLYVNESLIICTVQIFDGTISIKSNIFMVKYVKGGLVCKMVFDAETLPHC